MKVYIFLLLIVFVSVGVQAQQKAIKLGDTPPEFSLSVVKSTEVDSINLADLKNRAVILDFWATWCAPCVKSFPHLNKLIEEFKEKPVTIISITYEPKDFINNFLEKHELKSIIATDNDFFMFKAFNGWAIPTMILINKNGKYAGRIHPKNLTAQIIDELLEGNIPKVEQVPENLYDPVKAEKYFRSLIKQNNE